MERQFIEQKLLRLDDTLGSLLTIDWKEIDQAITIRQLLCHTSGIPDYFDESTMNEYEELWKDYPNYKISNCSCDVWRMNRDIRGSGGRKSMQKPQITSYCGLDCDSCEFKDSCGCGGCVATKGKPFHGHCDVAECAVSKGKQFCGDCECFPCATLKRYSFDPEHGDNGARLDNCSQIKAGLVAAAREGLDPIAYCGFSCNHCFLGQPISRL